MKKIQKMGKQVNEKKDQIEEQLIYQLEQKSIQEENAQQDKHQAKKRQHE